MNNFQTFDSVESFHAARGGRNSEEADFGFYNQWDLTPNGAMPQDRFRVSVIKDTLDVYAILARREPEGSVILLGKVSPGTKRNPYADADERFMGWHEKNPKNLSWFLERVIPLATLETRGQ